MFQHRYRTIPRFPAGVNSVGKPYSGSPTAPYQGPPKKKATKRGNNPKKKDNLRGTRGSGPQDQRLRGAASSRRAKAKRSRRISKAHGERDADFMMTLPLTQG